MIKVVKKKNDITIKGHALFDEYGKDIVCSSVSSIVTTTVNACLMFDKKSIKYKVKKGLVKIENVKKDDYTNKLINNMINLLKDLSKSYPENIKIEGV